MGGAFNPTSGEAAVGVIVRYHFCNPYLMAWKVLFHCRNAEEAEVQACIEGV